MSSELIAVAERAERLVPEGISALSEYLAIPAISCQAENAVDVRRLADRIRQDLESLGFEARLLELDGALPCVAAQHLGAGPEAPTVLVYGHLDLQPVNEDNWRTDPHVATTVGDRLYARGAADDMGGWVSHFVAMRAWLETAGRLPCNVRLLIEGEEEIGSPNLERYMDAFPEVFQADAMVLTDCENPSTEVPGLTVSLRGLMEIELTCTSAHADVHSGLWGNAVPDPVLALMSLIARLVDEDGRLVPGRVTVPESWAAQAHEIPLHANVVQEGAHLLPGVAPLPERGRTLAEWVWRQPAMTVVSTTLPTRSQKKNAIRRSASAILSLRVPPGGSAQDLYDAVVAELTRDAPGGVLVSVAPHGTWGDGWLYEPAGEAFAAADRAYRAVWGHDLVQVGVGGSIPFVAMFGRRFSNLPLILNGVMDPLTTAHGPNESLHLGVFRKAVLTNVRLYAELAASLSAHAGA
jgi:acetylornithine deacetylase/succinyl-diaminopimelate desuccinylase-like protein